MLKVGIVYDFEEYLLVVDEEELVFCILVLVIVIYKNILIVIY